MMNQMASQIPAPPMPNGGAAIYATATCSPNTSNSTNPIYAGQQMMLPPGQQPANNYGQTNGTAYNAQPQYGIPPVPQMPIPQMQQQQQPSPQIQQVNAPPQAPPPPMPPAFSLSAPSNVPQPPAPPLPPASGGGGGGAAPPPPPPPPGANLLGGKGSDAGINSLALQLATAKLKRSQPPKSAPAPPVSTTVTENSGSSTSSGGRSSSGMASMMDEMAKTLARRRAQAEKKEPDPADDGQSGASNGRQRAWEKSSTLPHKLGSSSSQNNANSNNTSLSGSESPKPSRKRFGSASEETILKQINGDSFSLPSAVELENFKEEILREMRSEIAKAKQEIIEAIKSEFNRR